MRSLEDENMLLQIKLQHVQRIKRFENNWLKRTYPDIYEAMQIASAKNDDAYVTRQMKLMNDACKRDFNL